ncbi:MAG TPA: hypothetical protein VIF62_31490 [Labilithrix sp.]|jgi:hypothetical protein
MEDEAGRRASEIIDALVESHGIVFVTPRGKQTVVNRLAEMLEELPLHYAPAAKLLADWLVAQDEVADLFADDDAIERITTAAGARPKSHSPLRDFALAGQGWAATIDCDLGANRTPASVDFGEGRSPPSPEEVARAEERVRGLAAFWPEIESAILERAKNVDELRAPLGGVVVHVGPELAPGWSLQIMLREPGAAWIVMMEDWTILDVQRVVD